jgi:hypothetical protein
LLHSTLCGLTGEILVKQWSKAGAASNSALCRDTPAGQILVKCDRTLVKLRQVSGMRSTQESRRASPIPDPKSLARYWSNTGQRLVAGKHKNAHSRSNTGQPLVNRWSNAGDALVKH